MKLKQFLMPLTGLALISLAIPSYAADYKILPGSQCQPVVGAESGSFRRDEGNITNISTQIRYVNCPLVRDWIPAASPGLDPVAWVASSNGALLTCQFFSMTHEGRRVIPPITRNTTASNATLLAFNSGGQTITTVSSGSYFIQCILPPGGRVINYAIGEPDPTGNL